MKAHLGLAAVGALSFYAKAVCAAPPETCEALGSSSFAVRVCRDHAGQAGRESVVRGRHGFEDFVAFTTKPAVEGLEYILDLPEGAHAEPEGRGARVVDASGAVRFRIEAPWLLDARGTKLAVELIVDCATGRGACRLAVDWSHVAATYPILVDPQWVTVDADGGALCTGRQFHTATATGAGSTRSGVLIVGGRAVPYGGSAATDAGVETSADAVSGAAPPDAGTSDATVADAAVIDATVAGGGVAGAVTTIPQPTAAVEFFDPVDQTIHQCRSLLVPRVFHTASWVNLPVSGSPGQTKGLLLVVGGYTSCAGHACTMGEVGAALANYEFYDPDTECDDIACAGGCSCPNADPSAVVYPLPDGLPRAEHSATVMPAAGGNVLVAGGTSGSGGQGAPGIIFDVSRAFDPQSANASWTFTGSSFNPTFGHASVYLPEPSGDATRDIVLLVGGSAAPYNGNQAESPVRTDSIFIPSGGQLETIGRDGGSTDPDDRPAHTVSAGRLSGAGVLVWGGAEWTQPLTLDFTAFFASQEPPVWTDMDLQASGVPWSSYSVATDTSAIPKLYGALVVGGISQGDCASTANASYLGTEGWSTSVSNLNVARVDHTVTPVNGGASVVAIGGVKGDPCSTLTEVLSSIEVLAVGEQGSPCDAGTACVTGFCADGVCCNQPCSRTGGMECQACDVNGFCGPSDAGTACGEANACGGQPTCDGRNRSCPSADASEPCSGPEPAPESKPEAGPVDESWDGGLDAGHVDPGSETFLSCAVSFSGGAGHAGIEGIGIVAALAALRARRKNKRSVS
ncbi:MAG TPA: hypothetical protein VK762_10255 [Polyangiaceae bacterium]|jgi:hypothetical protein|nr:hypothetical protein [Polyangiaceae bacterium]